MDTKQAMSVADLESKRYDEHNPSDGGEAGANLPKKPNAFARFCKYIGTAPIVLFIICLISIGIFVACELSEVFADFINVNVDTYTRRGLAWITGVFPVSFAECLIYLLPVIIGVIIWRAVVASRKATWRPFWRFFATALAVLSIFQSLFVFTYGMGYRGSTLDKKLVELNLELSDEIEPERLAKTAEYLAAELNKLVPEITYLRSGESIMLYDFATLNDKLNDAWAEVSKNYSAFSKEGYPTRVKPVVVSEMLSWVHTLGVYSYFTGEANVNTEFPDYGMPYTMAHEMAHQRGVAREEEANFMAYLVCMSSDDPYIRYSGYLNTYEYVRNELYALDSKNETSLGRTANGKLRSEIKGEFEAYSTFFNKYRESPAANIQGKVNDTFLKGQGQKEGINSYNLVVRFTVALVDSLSKQ